MNLSDLDKQRISEICRRNDISFCALFGSFARGGATDESDIDLLVRFSKPKGYNFLDAAFEIEEALGRKVDLITEKGLSKHVREYAYRDLQVLYGERHKITDYSRVRIRRLRDYLGNNATRPGLFAG